MIENVPDFDKEATPDGEVTTNPNADYLGVTDGQFAVRRTDGSVEIGWSITGLQVDPKNSARQLVSITDATRGLVKEVSVDRLLSWQQEQVAGNIDADHSELPGSSQKLASDAHENNVSFVERRRRRLFAPPLVKGEFEPHREVNHDFSYLLQDGPEHTAEEAQQMISAEGERQREKIKDVFVVTPEKEAAAEVKLTRALYDSGVQNILQAYSETNAPIPDLVKLIRTSGDVRWELANYFLGKIEQHIQDMPRRVAVNTSRALNYPGYSHVGGDVPSREYVARMCLNMLDGTYDIEADVSDPIDTTDGEVRLGQHREAALRLLAT